MILRSWYLDVSDEMKSVAMLAIAGLCVVVLWITRKR